MIATYVKTQASVTLTMDEWKLCVWPSLSTVNIFPGKQHNSASNYEGITLERN